jgi:hypothetical protein
MMGQYPNPMPYPEEGAQETVAQMDELKRLLQREPTAGGVGAQPEFAGV